MPIKSAFNARVILGVSFAALATVSGLASCGGAGDSINKGQQYNEYSAPNIYISASPSLISNDAADKTSVITWQTTLNGASCSSSPSGITGTSGTFTTPVLTKTTTYTVTCGTEKKKVTIALTPAPLFTAITAQQTSCANDETVRDTTYYYCDCGKGASANCDASNADDANDGTINSPRKTLLNAITTLTNATGKNAIRFCKGGAFDATRNIDLPNVSCASGTTCTDFREYDSPLFVSTAKPVLNSATGTSLFRIAGGRGGVRILNLKLHGIGSSENDGIFLYAGAHDVMACNLDITGFSWGVDQNPGSNTISANSNITITGNNFSNNIRGAYFGAGPTTEISKNNMTDNGSGNIFDHTVYLGSGELDALNMMVSENYMYGQIGTTCLGVVLVGHGRIIGANILNNLLEIDEAADSPGCYGIALDHGGYDSAASFSNSVISGNTLVNTGGVGIVVANCADCFIENNVLGFNRAVYVGILAGEYDARATYPDTVNNRNTIRNNTIWFGASVTSGITGIQIRNEGIDHVIEDNTISYTSTSAGNGVNCFDYALPIATAYTSINNNNCESAAIYKWDKMNGPTLADWQSYVTLNGFATFDSTSTTGTTPPSWTILPIP